MKIAAALATRRARPETETGMLLMALAMLMIPGIDAIAKLLSASLAPGQVACGRFLFQSLILLPVVLAARAGTQRPMTARRLAVHAARGALFAAATLLFFSALKALPLADAIAIFFVEPLILTLLSALFLGEAVGWRRLSAILVGFAGALIIIRPSWEVFGWSAVLPLGAAACFAAYLALTRHQAQSEGVVEMQLWSSLFGFLLLSLALAAGGLAGGEPGGVLDLVVPVWPSAGEWLLLAAIGVIATTGHLFVVMAFRRAAAGILAPFQYLEIIGATLLGLLVFGDFPDAVTWLGIAIIVGAGLYVFHRERRLARHQAVLSEQP